jgi:hypothetical protein
MDLKNNKDFAKGHLDVLKLVIDKLPKKKLKLALNIAILEGHTKMTQYLLTKVEASDKVAETPKLYRGKPIDKAKISKFLLHINYVEYWLGAILNNVAPSPVKTQKVLEDFNQYNEYFWGCDYPKPYEDLIDYVKVAMSPERLLTPTCHKARKVVEDLRYYYEQLKS